MEGIPIRVARRGDIPSLVLLWNAQMEETAKLDPRLGLHTRAREHAMQRFADWLGDERRFVVVAEEDRRLVVGFAAAVLEDGSGWQMPRMLGRITDCYVAPPRRRAGLGRRLVGRLTDLLYEGGAESARVAVAAQSEGALSFWRSVGWADLETVVQRDA